MYREIEIEKEREREREKERARDIPAQVHLNIILEASPCQVGAVLRFKPRRVLGLREPARSLRTSGCVLQV